jgi:hypothetical protein
MPQSYGANRRRDVVNATYARVDCDICLPGLMFWMGQGESKLLPRMTQSFARFYFLSHSGALDCESGSVSENLLHFFVFLQYSNGENR